MKKNIYVSYLLQVALSAVTFLYSLVFLKLLGPSSFGEYSIFFNSIVFFVLVFGLNLSSILPFFIVNNKIDPGKFLFSAATYLVCTTIFVFSLLWWSDSLGFSQHIFPGGDSRSSWIIFFTVHYFLLQLNQLLTSYLNAHKIFIPVSVFNLAVNLLMVGFWLLVGTGLVKPDVSYFDLIWVIFIIGNSLILIYLLKLVRQISPGAGGLTLLGSAEVREVLKFTGIVYICNAVQFLVYRIDLYFVNAFFPGADVGSYSLALSLSQLIWILPNSVSTIIVSYLSMKERDGSVRLGVKYASISLYGSVIVAALFTAVLYFLLPAVYGNSAPDIFRLSLIMFLGTIPFSVTIILANMNSGIGFVKLNLYATIIIFAVTLLLDALVIPVYGIYGAATVKVIIYLAGLIIQIIFGRKNYALPWRELFKFPRFREL